MKESHPFFSVKVDEKTDKLLIVLRKKSFVKKDPIIASTIIKRSEIPQKFNDIANTEMKTINLLEPLQNNGKKNTNRKVVGKFNVLFSLSQELPYQKSLFNHQMSKKHNGQGYSKIDSCKMNENDNENLIFCDFA